MAAGEAICFGFDSVAVPYVKEAGVIFAFYATGVLVFCYLAAFHITETQYHLAGEDGVVIPKHVMEEHARDGVVGGEMQASSLGAEQKTVPDEKLSEPAL